MKLLIKNSNIIDCNKNFFGDIYIKDGVIKKIEENISIDATEVIDANGYTLMPSFIDTHAHFRDPGLTYKEDIETGSRAALRGGYTGVCLMANTSPICSNTEVLNYVRNKSTEINLIDIHQCVSITNNFDGKTLTHLESLKNDSQIKAISDDGLGVMNSAVMLEAMKIAKNNNWIVMSHAEDHNFSKTDMRIAENIMTLRDLYLAKESKARLHMAHVSTKEAIKYIKTAKEQGVNITCEVTPHHISLINEICNYRVNPPIREKEDVLALHQAIKDGIVDCIGTDHAPHTAEDKLKGFPGMVGLETAFPICYTSLVRNNVITINKLSEIMSKNSADILAMNKGEITIGKDADLVLVDLNKKIKINSDNFASKGKNSPFDKMEFYGEIVMTIKSGKILYEI